MNYEMIIEPMDGHLPVEGFLSSIHFVTIPSAASRVTITLPDNCLVLHKDWDKYVLYMLDNDKPMDAEFIKRRLGLTGRPDNGVFPDLSIVYPVNIH